MISRRYIPTIVCLAFATAAFAADSELPAGSRAIFTGKDLAKWHGVDSQAVEKLPGAAREKGLSQQRTELPPSWRVENGELINAGTGPCATTDEEFGDMEVQLEYKMAAGADGGVYLRGNPQVKIWDANRPFDPTKPELRPDLGSGGLFYNNPEALGRDPIQKGDKQTGQWNILRIRQIGARTWVWLNTRTVVEGAVMENYWDRTKPLPDKGPIMLQAHGGEIRWRNISVHEIDAAEAKQFLIANPPQPDPTVFDVSYGPHPRQVIHFWKAKSDQPTPLLLFIHGGGWTSGGRLGGMLKAVLKAGISVASVEYRFIAESTADGEVPPVRGPMHDSARALQFIRSKATEWNIDKKRIAASGGSAGACSSLWLAYHNDLADPKSSDPVARESTRLLFAAVSAPQTTLDPQQMKEWTPNSVYGGHAFGFKGDPAKKLGAFEEFLAGREKILPWIAEYSPYALVTADDPPVYLSYSTPPALGQNEKDPTHTANFGVKLQEHCRAVGVECELVYPGAPDVKEATIQECLIQRLTGAAPAKSK